jgi:hypothetical protein
VKEKERNIAEIKENKNKEERGRIYKDQLWPKPGWGPCVIWDSSSDS